MALKDSQLKGEMGHWVFPSFFQLLRAQLLRLAGVGISGPAGDRPVRVTCILEKGKGPFAIGGALDLCVETV